MRSLAAANWRSPPVNGDPLSASRPSSVSSRRFLPATTAGERSQIGRNKSRRGLIFVDSRRDRDAIASGIPPTQFGRYQSPAKLSSSCLSLIISSEWKSLKWIFCITMNFASKGIREIPEAFVFSG